MNTSAASRTLKGMHTCPYFCSVTLSPWDWLIWWSCVGSWTIMNLDYYIVSSCTGCCWCIWSAVYSYRSRAYTTYISKVYTPLYWIRSPQYPKWLGIVHQVSLGPRYQESKYKGGKALFGGTFSIKFVNQPSTHNSPQDCSPCSQYGCCYPRNSNQHQFGHHELPAAWLKRPDHPTPWYQCGTPWSFTWLLYHSRSEFSTVFDPSFGIWPWALCLITEWQNDPMCNIPRHHHLIG